MKKKSKRLTFPGTDYLDGLPVAKFEPVSERRKPIGIKREKANYHEIVRFLRDNKLLLVILTIMILVMVSSFIIS